MDKKRKLFIGSLCTLLGILSIIYIVITDNRNFNDTVMNGELFNVKVTDVLETNIKGNAKSVSKPIFKDTIINFDMEFSSIDDSITYNIQLTNQGSIDAVINKINIDVNKDSSIKYSIDGIKENDKLKHDNSTSFSIKIDYISKSSNNNDKENIKVVLKLDCIEDVVKTDGTGNSTIPKVNYQAYSIGDIITFNNSNWIVLRNSPSTQDYVTLIKEDILTSKELGNYASNCDDEDISGGINECNTTTNKVNAMYYYRSDNCKYNVNSNRKCVNDFSKSYVNQFFKNEYINTLGENKLKSIDGYKIRLLNDEDIYNLGISKPLASNNLIKDYQELPDWLISGVYWTMLDSSKVIEAGPSYSFTSAANYSHNNYAIGFSNNIVAYFVYGNLGIRPVINLLKTSI